MLELKKEIKQNPAALALLGISEEQEGKEDKAEIIKKPSRSKTTETKKRNSRGYQRYRGKGGTKPMSYYIPQDIIDLLNVRAAKDGVSKSSLVVEGLRYVLKDELRELKNKEKEKEKAESEVSVPSVDTDIPTDSVDTTGTTETPDTTNTAESL